MIPSDIRHRLQQLSDTDAHVREEAVDALVAIGSDELVDALAALPRGGEAWKSVARTLGKIGSARAIAVLEEALDALPMKPRWLRAWRWRMRVRARHSHLYMDSSITTARYARAARWRWAGCGWRRPSKACCPL